MKAILQEEIKPLYDKFDILFYKLEKLEKLYQASQAELKSTADALLIIKNENKALRGENMLLLGRIEQLQQHSRKNNIISNIPMAPQEDLNSLVVKIGEVSGVKIANADIDVCHRLQKLPRQQVANIMVRLVRRNKKFELLRNIHLRWPTLGDIGFSNLGAKKSVFCV